ncbi:related to Glutamyl-tRNA synthetase (mitochondrial) [Ramularia collo-cygni]|uniref:glutamate--tRNA ligase n=1 Tax=Ramularia collo-cygni TaxID=112498 RepID=A0A2D3VNV2_9PEZI|nr:related to Glutamyl-tRNA synthetase (mitochondrial) [Ramularia collo-cygni]CZT23498.1 related to Glutamyl-tRNA synthetase (mitochondrial) [Ramularia collo-cygni]
MHIGGLRTALFSYLLAKKTGGQFLLRIEDTDAKRFVKDAEQRLCDDLRWAGLEWDEGPQIGGAFGPYKQSQRNHIYQEYAKQLVDSGSAYRCFCASTNQNVGNVAYSTGGCHQSCSSLPSAQAEERAVDGKEAFTVRLRPPPASAKRVFPDLVYGKVQRLKRSPSGARSEDGNGDVMDASDPVLVKSDGIPTYHFANVVDDHLMKITHVIRGSEWLASLPLHYDLYNAFGWEPPLFAHVGLLVDQDGAKLSKRSNNAFSLDIPTLRREQGILPEALRNYLALLGWSNPQREDLMDLSELIENFDLKFVKGNAVVTPNKLWYLQKGHVFRRCKTVQENGTLEPIQPIVESIEKELLSLYSASDIYTRDLPLQSYIAQVLLIDAKDYITAPQFVARNQHFFHFDHSQVPTTTTTTTVMPEDITLINKESPQQLLSRFLSGCDLQQSFQATTSAQIIPKTPEGSHAIMDALAKDIFAALQNTIYRSMLTQNHPSPEIGERVMIGLRFLEQKRASPAQLAAYVAGQLGNGITPDEVLSQQKSCLKVLMKVLRTKLCYGLPGPSMGHVMAVLGWEECCRRMGVDGSEAKG